MKVRCLDKLQDGYNAMTSCEGLMLMDIGFQVVHAGASFVLKDLKKETAFVILTGKVVIRWKNHQEIMERISLFGSRLSQVLINFRKGLIKTCAWHY